MRASIVLFGAVAALMLSIGTAGAVVLTSESGVTVTVVATTGETDLGLTIPSFPSELVAGEPGGYQYTFKVENFGVEPNAGLTLTGTLPEGVTFSSGTGCVDAPGSFTCALDALDAGANHEFTVTVNVAASAAPNPDAQVSASVVGDGTPEPDPDDNPNSASAPAPIVAQANLSVTNALEDLGSVTVLNSVVAGNDVRYTIVLTNGGPSDAQDVVLTDTVDSLLQDVKFCEGADCTPDTALPVSEELMASATLEAGATRTFIVQGSLPSDAVPTTEHPELTNTASLASSTTDPGEASDSADANAPIATRADLAISETASVPESLWGAVGADTVVAGDDRGYFYTVTVTNKGPSDNVGGFTVVDVLPPGASYVEAPEASSDPCSVTTAGSEGSGDTVTCDGGNLTATGEGASQVFTIRARVPASESPDATYDDAATVAPKPDATVQPEGDTDDNASSASLKLIALADLEALSLTHDTPFTDPDTVFANDDPAKNVVTYTYMFRNNGPSDSRNVVLSMPLPHDPPDASLIGLEWGYCQTADCTVSTFLPYPATGDSFTIDPAPAGSTTTVVVRAKADPNSRAGAFQDVVITGTVDGDTPEPENSTTTSSATDATEAPNDLEIDTVPNAPEAILATAGNAEAGLQWRRPDNDGGQDITDYRIYACRTSNPALCVTRDIPDENENATFNGEAIFSYVISGLTNGISYTLTVTAFNAVGESDRSNGLTVTPTQVADTEVIANNTATVDTGVGTGAVGCAQATNPDCRNIVSTYTINDPNNNGSLVNVNAEGRNSGSGSDQGFESLGGMALLAAVVAEPVFECIEVDLNSGVEERATENCGKGDKVIRSTYPLAEGDRLHLETDVYDRTITTDAAGVACLSLKTNPDGTLPRMSKAPRAVIVNCDFPAYPKLFTDANGNKTNICPHGTGWKPLKPCAYVYFASVLMPGFDISGFRPQPCTTGPNCNRTTLIGSSVAAGIRIHPLVGGLPSPAIKQIVRPWCTGIFPFFVWKPCVARYVTLPGLPSSPNLLDMRVDTFMNNDPLKTGSTG